MKFRLVYFGSHLLISVVIGVALLLLVYGFWYPSPLDLALGVKDIFLLLLCVDVVVGPLLTFLVAKQGKKTLRTDLLVIGIMQAAALIYGVYMVAQGRPVWIVYDSGRFELVQAYEAVITEENPPILSSFDIGLSAIKLAAVKEVDVSTLDRRELYYRGEYLQAYSESVAKSVEEKTLAIGLLKKYNDPERVDKLLQGYSNIAGYVPLAAKEKSLVMLIQKNSGMPLAILDLSPW